MSARKPIKKAVFPVAGLGTRFLPATKAIPKELLPIVDRPLIQYAVDEAREAGIEQIIFVTGRGKTAIVEHFDVAFELETTMAERGKDLSVLEPTRATPGDIITVRQQVPLGLGHAIWCARAIVGDDPFAILLPDELMVAAKGGGTGGSRSIPLGGVSVSAASKVLAEKMKKLAADELEASAADIELVDGSARIVGTDRVISYADMAKAAKSDEDRTGLADVVQDEATYPNGTHICEVEIDPETGHVEIVRYTIVDDFGMTVNPVLLLGQIHGGVVQGVAQCLSEGVVYSEDGQLLTASFMDYAVPRADGMPFFDFETRNVPSTTNAMGIKGAGEAGTIGACPAAMNALVDALDRARGVRHIEMPATPQRIWEALNG